MVQKTYKDFEELNEYIVKTFGDIRNKIDPIYRDEAKRILQCIPSLPKDLEGTSIKAFDRHGSV